jgi:hypothetical protein
MFKIGSKQRVFDPFGAEEFEIRPAAKSWRAGASRADNPWTPRPKTCLQQYGKNNVFLTLFELIV